VANPLAELALLNGEVGLQPARVGSTPPIPPEDILLTTGGWFEFDGARATLATEVSFRAGDRRPRGPLTFSLQGEPLTFHGTEILGLDILDGLARVALSIGGSDGSLRSARVFLQDRLWG